ncbi:MAG: hypothetical protein ACRDTT_32690, partial [Pseudonocardiaceae bacterium]
YTALWFYLGVRDRRATRVPVKDIKPAEGQHALIDPDLGTVHLLKCGQAKLDGDERLLRDLARYYQEWEALGRPAVPDWSCELSPTGVEDTPIWVPDRWRLRGEPIEDALVRLAARRG